MPAQATNTTTTTTQKDILMLFMRADGMKSRAHNKGNILGAADSFYEIKNVHGQIVATSAVLYNDQTPKWAPIKLDMQALCNHDEHEAVTLSFYDHHSNHNNNNDTATAHDELMGTVVTSVAGMMDSARDYRNQCKTTSLGNAKASHEFGEWIRLFIYDVIATTGTPTTGTMTTTTSNADTVVEDTVVEDTVVVEEPVSSEEVVVVETKQDPVVESKTEPQQEKIHSKKQISVASTIGTDDDEEVDSLLNLEIVVIHDEDGDYDRQCCGTVSLPAYIAA